MQKSNENFSDFVTTDPDQEQYWNYYKAGWICSTCASAFLVLGSLGVGIPIVRVAITGSLFLVVIGYLFLLAALFGYQGYKYLRLARGTYHFQKTLRMRKKCIDVHK